MTTLIVCITYNSGSQAVRYLDSLMSLASGGEALQVVVVDNGASEPFQLPPRLAGRNIAVVRPPANLGYFGGAAFGFRHARESAALPDVCIVSNVDLLIPQADFLTKLESAFVEGVGVVAPSIRSDLTGNDQNPFMVRRPSRARMRAYIWLFSSYPAAALYERAARLWGLARRGRRRGSSAQAGIDIYAPHGSFVALSRRFFELGGGLEYGAFLFNEEIHVAEQARGLGLRVRYCPELEVIHGEHVSVGRYRSRRMVLYAQQAAKYCFERYFKRGRRS